MGKIGPAGVRKLLEVRGRVTAGLLLFEETGFRAEEITDQFLALTQDAAGFQHHTTVSIDYLDVFKHRIL